METVHSHQNLSGRSVKGMLVSDSFLDREATSSITMVVVLVSFSMLFATLFLAYAIYRFQAPVWPPMGMNKVNLFIPSLSTIIAISGSLVFYFFNRDLKRGLINSASDWLNLCVVAGLGFLMVQWQLWSYLKSVGIFASSGIFGSLNFGFTWIHAAHIVIALFLTLWLRLTFKRQSRCIENGNEEEIHGLILKSQNIGKFWHFLTIVWLIIFLFLFLI